MKALLLKPLLWWGIAGSCAAVGGTVYVVHKTTTVVHTSDSSTTASGATEPEGSTAPPTDTPVLASTTLLGSPFTITLTTPVLTVPPSTAPATTTPSTVAPCPPCPQFDYQVLAATTVTNTGPTTVSGGVGLWPGTAVTGFPPGIAIVDAASPAAADAQAALTAAFLNAMLQSATTVNAQLAGQTLTPGVYAGPAHMNLVLDGTLVLDGPGVYLFQTDSTLVTGSGSRVVLVNGARACDVTWVVGSSATLGTGSTFAGTIMALASITVTTDVTVQGRALARTGAVTLDSDTFIVPSC